jgi:hypothetical protein
MTRDVNVRPNQRLKLSGCGDCLVGKGSLLIAAAAPRSLSATRWAASACDALNH